MNKTIKTKESFLESIKYYGYMFVLIVLFFLILGILSAVNT